MSIINRCVSCNKILFKVSNLAKVIMTSEGREQSSGYICDDCEQLLNTLVDKIEEELQVKDTDD